MKSRLHWQEQTWYRMGNFKEGVEEILNLQPKGSQAKLYQVKQVRTAIVKYRLAGGNDDK